MRHITIRKYILTPVILLCLAVGQHAQAQAQVQTDAPYGGRFKMGVQPASVADSIVTLRADIDITSLELDRNTIVTFSPVLRSLDGRHEIAFEQVSVVGKRRYLVRNRSAYFGDKVGGASDKNTVLFGRKDNAESIELEYQVPFRKWMRHSQLVITEQTTACCDIYMTYPGGHNAMTYTGIQYTFPAPYEPTFSVAYMEPEPESVKVLSETHTAALSFGVNRTDLVRGFGSNASVLSEVDGIMGRVKSDSLLTVSNIIVRGYASPEGTEAGNLRLSQGRAQAFVGYLQRTLDPATASLITAQGMGEDWAGLRKAVADSYIDDRDRVLAAIDGNSDVARRKTAIRSLSGGRTYRILLEDYYPALRRNEYTIEYQIRGFNAAEAQGLVWDRPQLLSLNEFYMAAKLYQPESREFKEIFDIAARMYPKSTLAQFNVGAMEIENGSYDTALTRLQSTDSPESWNNQGVALWYKGEYEQAREMFGKAAETGLTVATENLAQYDKWFADRDE